MIIKGDGIGPEVVDLMLNVLKECNMQAEIINCEAGSEQWEKNGSKDKSYIPDVTMEALEVGGFSSMMITAEGIPERLARGMNAKACP